MASLYYGNSDSPRAGPVESAHWIRCDTAGKPSEMTSAGRPSLERPPSEDRRVRSRTPPRVSPARKRRMRLQREAVRKSVVLTSTLKRALGIDTELPAGSVTACKQDVQDTLLDSTATSVIQDKLDMVLVRLYSLEHFTIASQSHSQGCCASDWWNPIDAPVCPRQQAHGSRITNGQAPISAPGDNVFWEPLDASYHVLNQLAPAFVPKYTPKSILKSSRTPQSSSDAAAASRMAGLADARTDKIVAPVKELQRQTDTKTLRQRDGVSSNVSREIMSTSSVVSEVAAEGPGAQLSKASSSHLPSPAASHSSAMGSDSEGQESDEYDWGDFILDSECESADDVCNLTGAPNLQNSSLAAWLSHTTMDMWDGEVSQRHGRLLDLSEICKDEIDGLSRLSLLEAIFELVVTVWHQLSNSLRNAEMVEAVCKAAGDSFTAAWRSADIRDAFRSDDGHEQAVASMCDDAYDALENA